MHILIIFFFHIITKKPNGPSAAATIAIAVTRATASIWTATRASRVAPPRIITGTPGVASP